jgi:Flp pilus assembly protein TadD
VEARTNLGVALAHEGRYSEAVAEYREALKRDPKNQVVLLNLALALYKQADFENASAELARLHSLNAGNQQAFYLLADCYLRLGRYHDAVVLLQPAYEAHPEDQATDYALGTALIQDGQVQKGR